MKITYRIVPTGKKFSTMLLYGILFYLLANCGGTAPLRFGVECECECNQGYPVVVRIFQLKSTEKFLSATTDALLRNAETALAGELVESTKIIEKTLAPCEKKFFSDKQGDVAVYEYLEINEEALFIGVFADFRRPAPDGWRQFFPVLANRHKKDVKVKINIKEDRLSISASE